MDINWPEVMITIPKGKGKKERIVLFTQECGEHQKSLFIRMRGHTPICKSWVFTFRTAFAAHLARKGMPLACIKVLLELNGPLQSQLYARLYHEAKKELCDLLM